MAARATAVEPPTSPSEPVEDEGHSGRLLLRMPQSLHGELARAAEREHVSLNAYITAALSATVGWRAEGGQGSPARPSGAPMSRLLRIAVIADLVLVAVAACVAVVLLIAAL